MIDEAAILTVLEELARDVFDDDTITLGRETSAADVPGWDSQGNIMFIVAAEQRFGVRLKPAEFERLRNVGDLAELIAGKLQGR
jgi:acyl carrier protein